VRLGPGRNPPANNAERQLDRTHSDEVAVNQPRRAIKEPTSHKRSVLATQIFDRCAVFRDPDHGVAPGNTGRIEKDLEIRITPQDVRTLAKRRAAVGPQQAKPGRVPLSDRIGSGWPASRTFKRIPEPVDGADEAGVCRIVTKGVANLSNQIDEVLLDDERVGPEALLKNDLRERLRPAFDEKLQELKGLRREPDGTSPSTQLTRVQIQHELSETQSVHFKPSTMNS
jgi:hypothetical protein